MMMPPRERIAYVAADGSETTGARCGRAPKIRRYYAERWLLDDSGPRDEWVFVLVAKRRGRNDPLPRELERVSPGQGIELIPDLYRTDEIVLIDLPRTA